jgi:hypothetical protein
VTVAPHGDDGRVFNDQKLVGNFAPLAALDQSTLQLEGFLVAHATDVAQTNRRPKAYSTAGRCFLKH